MAFVKNLVGIFLLFFFCVFGSPTMAQNLNIKEFDQVIGARAVSETGLITVYNDEGSYFFEIPEKLLGKELLIVSRISGVPYGYSHYGAGVYTRLKAHQVIRFQRFGNSILMRLVSLRNTTDTSNVIRQSLGVNDFEPIIYVFKITAFGKGRNSYVVGVNEFFTSHIPLIGVKSNVRGLDPSRCMISSVKVFSKTVEVRHVVTYWTDDRPFTDRNNSLSFELNQTFVLLPDDPMPPRVYDRRVRFNYVDLIDHGSPEGTKEVRYITRWRLEPSDWKAFQNGKLVEPIKPIVLYLDPATPKEFRSYIRRGVEDWQPIFESIGFKNAIVLKDPPAEDPNWDINDFRHSVIRFIPTERSSASVFNVVDPRTGEILKSDIHIGENYVKRKMRLFFITTAAANPKVRGKVDLDVLGELIRQGISHEIGHALGLSHNMAASSAYVVDSLRSPKFTTANGLSSSIMDYTFGNYVAQPGDNVIQFLNVVGESDRWAIQYGYKPVHSNVVRPCDEVSVLEAWVNAKVNDPIYCPIVGVWGEADLGADPIAAADLGLRNLQRIVKNLILWVPAGIDDYTQLDEYYQEVYEQFFRCLEPLIKTIGGQLEKQVASREKTFVYQFIDEKQQKAALKAISDHVFKTPTWLISQEIHKRIKHGLSQNGIVSSLGGLQKRVLHELTRREMAMIENEAFNGGDAYTVEEMYADLIDGIFHEIKVGAAIDLYRRNLQTFLIEEMVNKLEAPDEIDSGVRSVITSSLLILRKDIEKTMKLQKDNASKHHLFFICARIDEVLSRHGLVSRLN